TGRPVKVWVFLADKGLPDAAAQASAVSGLRSSYGERAIARRLARRSAPGLFDARDLPVAQRYLDALTEAGAPVHATSRWLDAASATVDAPALARVAALPFVTGVQLVARSLRPSLAAQRRAAPAAAGGAGGGAGAAGAAATAPSLSYG